MGLYEEGGLERRRELQLYEHYLLFGNDLASIIGKKSSPLV
jgi:hypothetical protein